MIINRDGLTSFQNVISGVMERDIISIRTIVFGVCQTNEKEQSQLKIEKKNTHSFLHDNIKVPDSLWDCQIS